MAVNQHVARHDLQQQLATQRDRIDALVRQGRLESAAAEATAMAAMAEEGSNPTMLIQAGRALERLGRYKEAYAIIDQSTRLAAGIRSPDWDGRPLPNGSLFLENRFRDVGLPIGVARLATIAAGRVHRCTLAVEPRLVPLFGRSFPGISVVASGADDDRLRQEASAVAGLTTLCALFAVDARSISGTFTPLVPDPAQVAEFRARYGAARPLVGISWHSTNHRKDLPPIEFWAHLIKDASRDFISLQYGEVREDLAAQRAIAGRCALVDRSVDQMKNLDLFAAQVAAMDAVVTISNTTAHVAGALGIPSIVILDDQFSLCWPVNSSRYPWYPKTRLIRKGGRDWSRVMDHVERALMNVLGARSAGAS